MKTKKLTKPQESWLKKTSRLIKRERKNKKLNLQDLSILTGLSISTISNFENASAATNITSIKKICDALNIKIIFQNENEETW